VVGFLGRFVPEKGLAVLTAALDRAAAPWRALIVGSGPEEAAIRRWAHAQSGRAAVVTGAGHADVPGWLNAMDVLCAPSLTRPSWREQFGRMLIEAMASGVPVVASDSGEIPAVVGDAGVVVPEGDAPAWTRALDALLGDPARRSALAAAGRARAESTYAWPVVARRHLAFFEELVPSRGE
jgi:glycosyltransferase involved in cell wall biosynthesis